jgi:hypothetical protein
MFYRDLFVFVDHHHHHHHHQPALGPPLTLIEFAEQSASNDARRCCTSDVQTASSDWSGTMRSDTCAVTDAGMTVGSVFIVSAVCVFGGKTPNANVLVGPDPLTLWIVSEGSRQREDSDVAD